MYRRTKGIGRGEARIRKAIRKWQSIEWMEAAAGIDASEPGRRAPDLRDFPPARVARRAWIPEPPDGGFDAMVAHEVST